MEWALIDQVLENIDILFMQFEDAKVSNNKTYPLPSLLILMQVKYANNTYMVNSINMGWWVLSKYYEESDKTPVYATVLLLHPEKRRRYINRHQVENQREPTVTAVRLYQVKYKDRPVTSTPTTKLGENQRELSTYERLKQLMCVLDGPGDEDEFEKFVNALPRYIIIKTPLEWWCREEQRLEYPRLH